MKTICVASFVICASCAADSPSAHGDLTSAVTGSSDPQQGPTCPPGKGPAWTGTKWTCGVTGVPTPSSGVSQIGVLPNARLDNWSPKGLATSSILHFQAADDEGTLVTGIDAVGAEFEIGHRITLCNSNAPQDAGVLALSAEDTSSIANNRIWTPGYGRNLGQTATERYTLAPSMCVDLIYLQPNAADASTRRWMIVDNTRLTQATIKQLSLYPYAMPAAITGTHNDWDPDDACHHVAGPANGSCEAGANVASTSYTVIIASTVDSTGATLTGLKYTSSQTADGQGPVKLLFNYGPGDLTLTNTDQASSQAANVFQLREGGSSRANVVLKPGQGMMFHHLRDTGGWIPIGHEDYYFDSRDVNMTKGLTVEGTNALAGVPHTGLMVDNSSARTSGRQGMYVRDDGTYDTTGGSIDTFGAIVATTARRNAGTRPLTNVALLLAATNGQTNYALQTSGGSVYFGVGSQMPLMYVNTATFDVSGVANIQGSLNVGSSAFGGTNKVTLNATTGDVTTRGGKFVSGAGGPTWTSGTGSPEGVVAAPVGSFYSRTDGGAGTTFYVKESGTGSPGWVAK